VPEVQELLSRIESREIKGVVVADPDRLLRPDNFNDFAMLQYFIDTNTLIFTSDQIIDLNTQGGFVLSGVQAILSGNELKQIKRRTQEAKEVKRKRGEHPNGPQTLPLGVGYKKDKGFYYDDDVHKIGDLFCLFYYQGIHNYRELERLTGIHHRTIPNLLKNELYIGYRKYDQKRSSEKRIKPDGRQADKRKVKREPDEIIRIKVIDDPIIDERVFREVQEIMANRRRDFHRKRSAKGERFLYSGFLRCGHCGQKIYSTSGGRNHKKDYYYCCTKNYIFRKKNGPSSCASKYISKEMIEHTITSFITKTLTQQDYLKKIIGCARSKSKHKDLEAELRSISNAIKNIEKKRAKIIDLYSDDLFTREELGKKVDELNDEVERLKMRQSKIQRSLQSADGDAVEKNIRLIISTVAEFEHWAPKRKRAFLRSQMPEFAVTNEGITGVTFNFCKPGNRTGKDSWQPPA
jgi:site-specific DNA recombinase